MKIPSEIPTVKEKITTPIQYLYEWHEFSKYISTIAEIVKKIKSELQIDSFSEFTEKLNSVLEQIPA